MCASGSCRTWIRVEPWTMKQIYRDLKTKTIPYHRCKETRVMGWRIVLSIVMLLCLTKPALLVAATSGPDLAALKKGQQVPIFGLRISIAIRMEKLSAPNFGTCQAVFQSFCCRSRQFRKHICGLIRPLIQIEGFHMPWSICLLKKERREGTSRF